MYNHRKIRKVTPHLYFYTTSQHEGIPLLRSSSKNDCKYLTLTLAGLLLLNDPKIKLERCRETTKLIEESLYYPEKMSSLIAIE